MFQPCSCEGLRTRLKVYQMHALISYPLSLIHFNLTCGCTLGSIGQYSCEKDIFQLICHSHIHAQALISKHKTYPETHPRAITWLQFTFHCGNYWI
jgi:hypothetical protein